MKIKQGKMRILLACADESLLKQTNRLMQASNELELVGCTSNGTKAWEMIRQKTPDMVVLDTDLPYADGFAVASWMRQNKMWDTSIILLSSFIGGQTYVECSLLHIVHRAWDKCDKAVLARYFGEARAQDKEPPSNREFCAALVEYLRQEACRR